MSGVPCRTGGKASRAVERDDGWVDARDEPVEVVARFKAAPRDRRGVRVLVDDDQRVRGAKRLERLERAWVWAIDETPGFLDGGWSRRVASCCAHLTRRVDWSGT